VLSLDEVLDITAGHVMLNVEIKSPDPDWETTAEVLSGLLARRAQLQHTVISCFEVGALRCMRQVAPAARLGMLWHESNLERMWAYAREIGAETVHPYWPLVDRQLVTTAVAHGLGVLTWTVNDIEVMRGLLASGVSGIISDYPERFDALGGPEPR
jgi:glycerophosphoryl diester phosphodiesterase